MRNSLHSILVLLSLISYRDLGGMTDSCFRVLSLDVGGHTVAVCVVLILFDGLKTSCSPTLPSRLRGGGRSLPAVAIPQGGSFGNWCRSVILALAALFNPQIWIPPAVRIAEFPFTTLEAPHPSPSHWSSPSLCLPILTALMMHLLLGCHGDMGTKVSGSERDQS